MSTRAYVLVAASLAVSCLGAFLWKRDARTPQGTRVAGRGDVVAESVTVAAARDGVAPATMSIDATSAKRITIPTAGNRVLVVDRSSGTPVPGADVWYRSMSESMGWNDLETDLEEYVRSGGARGTTDERGEAFLPVVEHFAAVVARSGPSYGDLVLQREFAGAARIEIGPDATVRVRVVDDAANPIGGVEVVVRQGSSDKGYGHSVARASTQASDGIATLAHLHQRAPEFLSGRSWAVAMVDGAFVPPVLAEFDPLEPPAEPLELVLPPAGRVVVLVKSVTGRALPDGSVKLQSMARIEGSLSAPGCHMERASRQGRAEFEHVGLGIDLDVYVQPSIEWPKRVVRHAGPRAAGEEVSITVEFDEPNPVLTGRLLDPAGTVRPHEVLSGRVVLGRQGQADEVHGVQSRTDAEGRFCIPVETTCDKDVRCTLHLRTRDPAEGVVLTADVALPEPLHSGENLTGDILLTEPAIALSGMVRDASGAPIYRALIEIARKNPDVGRNGAPQHELMTEHRAMTDKQGGYAVSGVMPPGEYFVEVRHEGHVATGLKPFEVGARNHDVVLRRFGQIEGSVRLPEGIAADRFVVEAKPHGAHVVQRSSERQAWSRRAVRVLPNAAFRLEEVPPGIVDVRVHLDGEDVVAIDAVEVPEDGASTDPRLWPVDLRWLELLQVRIRIEGPAHTRAPAAIVTARPAGDPNAVAHHILCQDGELVVVSRGPAIDLEVRAVDMRVLRREGVTADVTVVLEHGIPLTVCLPASIELPTAPDELSLVLSPAAIYETSYEDFLHEENRVQEHQYSWWFDAQAQSFDARRELTFHVPEPGPYVVDLSVKRRGVSGGSTFASIQSPDEDLRVLVSDTGQVIELSVRPEDVAEALARQP